jgi:hypothetical protein
MSGNGGMIMSQQDERHKLEMRITMYRQLTRRVADEEFVTRARDKLTELERQLREIEDEGKTGKL